MFEAPTPELTLAHSTLYLADFQHDVDHDVDNWQSKNLVRFIFEPLLTENLEDMPVTMILVINMIACMTLTDQH